MARLRGREGTHAHATHAASRAVRHRRRVVGVISSFAAAVGTLALAGLSYWSIRKSNQMIAVTQEEVAAVRAQTEAAQALLGQNQELITASRAEVAAVLDQVRAAQATVEEMKVERSL